MDEIRSVDLSEDFIDDELVEVEPIDHKHQNGNHYTQRYEYRVIHVKDVDIPVQMDGARYIKTGLGLIWKYRDKPDLLITEESCYTVSDVMMEHAEKNCHHAVSWLASNGYVSYYRKA